jgi:hypothetical protein
MHTFGVCYNDNMNVQQRLKTFASDVVILSV